MNEPTYPKRIEAGGNDVEFSPGRMGKERIAIYILNSAGASKEEVHPADMLVIFPTIKESVSNILEAWFSKAELLRPVFTLFFGSMYFSSMYPRFHFLNLIQAAETFHRNMRKGKYTSKGAFEKICQVLKKAIPEEVCGEFRESLESRISFGNEYSLRTRIKLLFMELEDETRQLLTQDVKALVGKIVATRNYFTHYTSSLKKKALSGDELHYANQKLRVLLIVLLLKEVGLSEPLIRDALCGNNELLYGLSEGRGVKAFLSQNAKTSSVVAPTDGGIV